ncbi:MAG TPA: polysaccharide deacetylase family protein, partial [Patescibacteria group bacterium]|nr:polysaccharide deacetylase family protein [Patescibacteria group bacterium]
MDRLRIALTFDAEHPDRSRCRPGVQDEILEVLDRLAVRATFFIQGRWAEAYPGTAARIAAAGHLIGSHSYYHARLTLFSDAGLAADISAAETAIRAA